MMARDVHVECGKCFACCKTAVNLFGDEDHTQYDVVQLDVPNLHDGSYPTYQLRQKEGICVYLENGRCSIYAKRPTICREFSCVLWVDILKKGRPRTEIRRALRTGAIPKDVWDAGVERS